MNKIEYAKKRYYELEKRRNELLDHHGDQQRQDAFIEGFCTDKPLQHTKETPIR